MLQLQTLRLQKQQRLNKLIGKTLDVLNVLLVNFVRDNCTMGDLIDIVGNIIRKNVEPFQFVLVEVDDVTLENHRTHEIEIHYRFDVAVATAFADSMKYDKKRKAA